jgi:hypothetical protein
MAFLSTCDFRPDETEPAVLPVSVSQEVECLCIGSRVIGLVRMRRKLKK